MATDPNPTTRRWLLGLLAIVTVLVIVAFVLLSVRSDGGDAEPVAIERGTALDRERAVTPDSGDVSAALRLVEYTYDPGSRILKGSLMNVTNFAYVNVQVRFDLLESDSSVVGEARDTTGTVRAGDTWLFNITVPGEAQVSAVAPTSITGSRMEAIATGDKIDPSRVGRLGGRPDSTAAEGQAYGNDSVEQ